jgi:hypothetical protein
MTETPTPDQPEADDDDDELEAAEPVPDQATDLTPADPDQIPDDQGNAGQPQPDNG